LHRLASHFIKFRKFKVNEHHQLHCTTVHWFIRRLLFAFPPEVSHALALGAIRAWGELSALRSNGEGVKCMGLSFPNRIGLAAGFDKDAVAVRGLGVLGFGFVEVGTVTPRPQLGNVKPRLFRSVSDRALINRLGFNSEGLDSVCGRLARIRRRALPIPLGVNIGKNRSTEVVNAIDDYRLGLRAVHGYADYVTINLSSPNTPGLRDLQASSLATPLLEALTREGEALTNATGRIVPLVVKVAPDLDENNLRALAEVMTAVGIDGVIATNTTISRPPGLAPEFAEETGGLSGVPLAPLALRAVGILRDALPDDVTIIGVGGICDVQSARAMFEAGADLLQIYTGFILEGPALIHALRALSCLDQRAVKGYF
jgi:dihydroorotate dehydrogenase